MKQTITLLVTALLMMAGVQTAQAQKMVVKTADGKAVKFNVNKVTEVTFEEAEPVEWVDLGLPSGTLWASCNIGANNPEDYGYYFAWGETEQKSDYTWTTYFDYDADDSSNRHKKYNKDSGLTELLPEDDAASANWDVSCKMPSKAQFEELLDSKYTSTVWTQRDGVNGYKITSIKNGNSIFLPAAGFYNGTYLNSQGSNGYYWSRSLSGSSNSRAGAIYFGSGSISTLDTGRMMGISVRPVRIKEIEPVQYEYVDLGLPSRTLWATMNVGANAPEDYGDYFAWGDTEPKSDYCWQTYEYGSYNNLNKYCTSSYYGYDGFTDDLTELEPEDDAATVNWGSEWQMPSREQCQELVDNCTWTWTKQNNVKGYLVTGTNGKNIFLPAAGVRIDAESRDAGENGEYWSSSLDDFDPNQAISISGYYHNSVTRCTGLPVRPVRVDKREPVLVEQIVLNLPAITLELNNFKMLTATVLPEDADNKAVTWESSNTSVVTVSSNGLVKAIAEGTCKITCRATDGSGVYAECQVTAIANSVREYVDLGLPSGTLWATMNVGATSPEEQGDTFRWGETEPYDGGSPDTYKFYGNYYYSEAVGFEIGDLTKYCSNSSYGYEGFRDYQTVLELEDDAATMNWGSEWHMPSKAQVEELGNSAYTALSFTTQNGVNGVLITSKTNGNIIFLPAQRDYWTREKSNDLYREATKLTLNWNNQRYSTGSFTRTSAYSVRPVREKEREYVDLGLPSGTLWATMNVGAGAPEDYGDYFAWGEIEPKSDYSWETYKWCKGSEDELTKYCTRSDNDFKDDLTELEPKDDAATVNWGSEWQMPSRAQCDELKAHTTQEWTTLNGVQGCLLTAPNGNSIFFPAASYMRGTETEVSGYLLGKFCDYGSRSLDTYLDYKDAPLTFVHPSIGSDIQYYNYKERCYGKTVRPVRKQ